MIDEPSEEAAALYVFHLLEGDEARAFAERVHADPELRAYMDRLEASVAQLAHAATPRALPPGLESKIRQEIQGTAVPVAPHDWFSWAGWAVAACLAAACFWLNHERAEAIGGSRQARSQLAEAQLESAHARQELAASQKSDALARVQIATLSSKLAQAQNATAVVVWDEEKQRGILKVTRMPKPAGGKDYQLWVIDPQYPQPVSAGIFQVEKPESTRVAFRAARPIGAAQKFAVSLEVKGGVPEVKGPIVMISE
jgi:anti-sigma-K factor RskA